MAKMKVIRVNESYEFSVLCDDELIGFIKPDKTGWVAKESNSDIWGDHIFEDRKSAVFELKRATDTSENYDVQLEDLKRRCGIISTKNKFMTMHQMKTLFDEKTTTTLNVKDFLKG